MLFNSLEETREYQIHNSKSVKSLQLQHTEHTNKKLQLETMINHLILTSPSTPMSYSPSCKNPKPIENPSYDSIQNTSEDEHNTLLPSTQFDILLHYCSPWYPITTQTKLMILCKALKTARMTSTKKILNWNTQDDTINNITTKSDLGNQTKDCHTLSFKNYHGRYLFETAMLRTRMYF